MHSFKKLFLLFFCLCTSTILVAQESIVKVKHASDFTITGDGSNAAWNNAAWNTITQRSSAVLKKENSVDAPNVAESYYDIVYVDDYTRDKVGGWKMLNTGEQIEIYRQRQIKFTTPKAGYYKLSTVTGEAPITEMWVDVR